MSKHYIANEYTMSKGVGVSLARLSSFDKALLDAGVGNYNLVRVSSILPSNCREVSITEIQNHIREGSLLPTAYATISSGSLGQHIASAVAVGIPVNGNHVGVIMEYSDVDIDAEDARQAVSDMVREAFCERGWGLREIKCVAAEAVVEIPDTTVSTFACLAQW